MIKAYKGFNKDLTCTMGHGRFQYKENEWIEESEANCMRNGFHCCYNPLDCLSYYWDFSKSVYYCLDKSDIYFDRIQRKESFIVFLRKVEDIEKPYYTLEIEPDGTTRQKRTTGDRQDKNFQEAVSFIRKWQREIKKRLNREDKKFAAQSAELRKKEFEELRKNQTKVWHGALAGKLLVDVLEADLMIANG